MAAAILRHLAGNRIQVTSAGVNPGDADPFAIAVMEELGIDMSRHVPASISNLGEGRFHLIITLAPEAHHRALDLAPAFGARVEYWPTHDPTLTSGNREQILDSYRAVRDGFFRKIKQRFPLAGAPVV